MYLQLWKFRIFKKSNNQFFFKYIPFLSKRNGHIYFLFEFSFKYRYSNDLWLFINFSIKIQKIKAKIASQKLASLIFVMKQSDISCIKPDSNKENPKFIEI